MTFDKRLLPIAVLAASMTAVAAETKTIGQVTALIPEASTAGANDAFLRDGQSGDTAFPFLGRMKAIATVGEVDAKTKKALTGYPGRHAAWLLDEDTIRVSYQSESYGPMSKKRGGGQTYGWEMTSGAKFTGSHIHTIDYDRARFASFLTNNDAASGMVKGSGHLFNRIYNQFGEEVLPRSQGGRWGNQTLANGKLVEFNADHQVTEGDFFFQSFCGAWYEPANKYGPGVGFANDVWLTAEEWEISEMFEGTGVDANDTLGLASVAVDIANQTAYTVPALGQSGFEKILPINPKHPDYVVLVMAGYNHDVEPAPLRIYVGKKGVDMNNRPVDPNSSASARDKFLARNGLLYGRIYGLALSNADYAALGIDSIETSKKMLDQYMTDANAPDTFEARFFPTSYQWKGWDQTVAVKETDVFKWQLAEEQPTGYTFFVGDSKTEHPAVDPDVNNQRYIQNMTNKGGMLGVTLTNFVNEIRAANGDLPESVAVDVVRTLPAIDGSLTLKVADKGVKHGGEGTHATWKDGTAKTTQPDGLLWVKTADADLLIVDEDSGNEFGERKFLITLDPKTMKPAQPETGYFLAMAGGKKNPRAEKGVSAYGGTFKKANSSEFSGTWNVTALVSKKSDGSFYSRDEIAGMGEQRINELSTLAESTFIGVLQHKAESANAVTEQKADMGGQMFMFTIRLPQEGLKIVADERMVHPVAQQ